MDEKIWVLFRYRHAKFYGTKGNVSEDPVVIIK